MWVILLSQFRSFFSSANTLFSFVTLTTFYFAVYCLDPPVVQHATHNGAPEATSFPLETVLKFACYPGYVTVGFAHAKCFLYNDTAQWFGPDITCKGASNKYN